MTGPKDKDKKKLLKAFIILFLISFLIINWKDISWVFNYKAVSGVFSNFFQKDDHQVVSDSDKQDTVNHQVFNLPEESNADLMKFDYTDKENSLEIPKIGILAPLVLAESSNTADLEKELDRGVVHFPSSALPGERGQTIVLGHSAPANWPKIKYDWVFSNISELNEGDKIFIHFNHRKYTYYVTKKIFLARGEEIPQAELTNSKNILVLVTCWPPGKDFKRIAVWAEGA